MAEIFISYRRSDSAESTSRIYDHLIQIFGYRQIFKDVDSIPPGESFTAIILDSIARAKCGIVIIGPNWCFAEDSEGNVRLQQRDDHVRVEIESLLARKIPVIPIFVRGAAMPRVNDVPESLVEFLNLHGLPIRSDPDFHPDLLRVVRRLRELGIKRAGKAPYEAQDSVWRFISGIFVIIRIALFLAMMCVLIVLLLVALLAIFHPSFLSDLLGEVDFSVASYAKHLFFWFVLVSLLWLCVRIMIWIVKLRWRF